MTRGRVCSEEAKQKQRLKMLGKIPVNKKNLPIEEIIQKYQSGKNLKEIGKAYNVSYTVIWNRLKKAEIERRGPKVFNKGKKASEETKSKMSKNGSKYWLGKKRSAEDRKKFSESHKGYVMPQAQKDKRSFAFTGEKNPFYGKIHTKETKNNIGLSKLENYKNHPEVIQKIIKARAKQIIPLKDTKIEIKIQEYSRLLGINFFTHQYLNEIKYAYQCDILIPVQPGITQKTIIECDGDYWHGNTKIYDFRKMPKHIKEQIPLDFERTAQLEEKGFRVIRLWEHEIKRMSFEDFKYYLKL